MKNLFENVGYYKCHYKAKVPELATPGSACYDLYCVEDVMLYPGHVKKIPTGIKLAIPAGYVGHIYGRSGLAARGIMLANGVGVIDSDYRGEVCVLLYNSTEQKHFFEAGSRIAQISFDPVINMRFFLLDTLKSTQRGEGGFGSTGD